MSKVILLNGASSSGKTGIAKCLQEVFTEPFFHLNVDLILEMAPEKLKVINPSIDDIGLQGFYWVSLNSNTENLLLESKTGLLAQKLVRSTYVFIREIVNSNLNLIIDDVFFSDERLKTYIDLIPHDDVYLIGVYCSLDELISRENKRKNRRSGEAAGQYSTVHKKIPYDFTVDSTSTSSLECAKQIVDFIAKNTKPFTFKQFRIEYNRV